MTIGKNYFCVHEDYPICFTSPGIHVSFLTCSMNCSHPFTVDAKLSVGGLSRRHRRHVRCSEYYQNWKKCKDCIALDTEHDFECSALTVKANQEHALSTRQLWPAA